MNNRKQTDEYLYDMNGNMISDANKDITYIRYNHLNLPDTVVRDTVTIAYTYDAAGMKLAKKVINQDTTTTQYHGPLVFENDSLMFMLTGEGKMIARENDLEYQYFIKDHLGNTRTVLTTHPNTFAYAASMESENEEEEESYFAGIEETRQLDGANAYSGNEFAALDNVTPLGPAIALKVHYGDTVDMSVYGKIVSNGGDTQQSVGLVSALVNAFTGSSILGETGTILSGGFTSGVSALSALGLSDQNSTPTGYLTWMVFDETFTYQYGGFTDVTSSSYTQVAIADRDMTFNGYVIVFLSYGSTSDGRAFFDDFEVELRSGPVMQEDDYYPGGLTFNSYTSGTENLYKYNGKEEQKETQWYDYHARMYDQALMRFMTIDPSADNYLDWTPYNYVGNNPINIIDPDGKDWYEINGKIRWRNKEGDYTNKKGQEFKSLGKNVLVVTHNRDKDGNEEVNSATFSLYLESDKSGATATLKGNTVPSDTEQFGTLAEGIYPAKFQARASKPGENALIINDGKEVPTVNGNPNKENSDNLTEVFFHRGNPYQKSLKDSNGNPVWSHGCLLGGCGPGSLDKFNTFMSNAQDFNGNLYLRAKPQVQAKTRATTKTHEWTRVNGRLTLVPKTK